jgi:aspartate kinase
MPDPTRKELLVMKFGGTSIAGPEEVRRAAKIVRDRLARRPVLVLSAMGKTTNNLLAAAYKAESEGVADISTVRDHHLTMLKELEVEVPTQVEELLKEIGRILEGIALLREISNRTRDLVVSFGERLSVRCFAAYFNKFIAEPSDDLGMMGVEAKALDSWEIGMHTTSGAGSADSAFSQVEVLPSTYEDILKNLAPLQRRYTYLPVITGYIAKDLKGIITTLGRDGSDLTATIVGASIDASEVQIWKDVPGIMTTDPRLVPAAKPVGTITYEEASELSAFGSKVVHPSAVIPAWIKKIPMSVRNSTAPESGCTHIVAELGSTAARDGRVVALSSKKGITVIGIRSTRMVGQHGFLAHVFKVFRDFEASVDVIATSEVSVSLTLDPSFKDVDLKGLIEKLEIYATVETKDHMAMLTLITGKKECTSVLRDAFTAFAEMNVNVEMVSHGASNVNVTFIIPEVHLLNCTRKMHEVFFER